MKGFYIDNDLNALIIALEDAALFVPDAPLLRYLLFYTDLLQTISWNMMEWSLVSTREEIHSRPMIPSLLRKFPLLCTFERKKE